jgi:hypothetical protein
MLSNDLREAMVRALELTVRELPVNRDEVTRRVISLFLEHVEAAVQDELQPLENQVVALQRELSQSEQALQNAGTEKENAERQAYSLGMRKGFTDSLGETVDKLKDSKREKKTGKMLAKEFQEILDESRSSEASE